MRTQRTLAAAFAGLVLTLAACGAAASPTPSGGTTVTATLTEYAIGLSAATAAPGSVTFTVTNAGTMVHEFVIFKTEVLAADLPITDNLVTEADYTVVDEVEDVEPGKSIPLTVTLEAGHYVLLCNVVGHPGQGMVVDFSVK